MLVLVCLPFAAMAEPEAPAAAGVAAAKSGEAAEAVSFYFSMTVMTAGLAIALGTLATGLAQGNAVARAVEGIARQPEAAGTIQTVMIIGLAFIESLTIYVLLISLILLFVNPFKEDILKLLGA